MEKFEIMNTELEALTEELKKVEFKKFCHECKDRWDSRDYEINRQFADQIHDLKVAIAALS